jgi:hypothetical protein
MIICYPNSEPSTSNTRGRRNDEKRLGGRQILALLRPKENPIIITTIVTLCLYGNELNGHDCWLIATILLSESEEKAHIILI